MVTAVVTQDNAQLLVYDQGNVAVNATQNNAQLLVFDQGNVKANISQANIQILWYPGTVGISPPVMFVAT